MESSLTSKFKRINLTSFSSTVCVPRIIHSRITSGLWGKKFYITIDSNFLFQISASVSMGTTLSLWPSSAVYIHRTTGSCFNTTIAFPSADGNISVLYFRRSRVLPSNTSGYI